MAEHAPTTYRRFVAAVLVGSLAACASLIPRIEPPTVTVVEVRLDRIEGPNAWFAADVTLGNPNPQEIAVDAIDAALSIEGEVVATATLAAPMRVPAGGSATAEMIARTGVDALIRAGAQAMRRLGAGPAGSSPTLRYALEGRAQLAGGVTIPFRRDGVLGAQPGKRS